MRLRNMFSIHRYFATDIKISGYVKQWPNLIALFTVKISIIAMAMATWESCLNRPIFKKTKSLSDLENGLEKGI